MPSCADWSIFWKRAGNGSRVSVHAISAFQRVQAAGRPGAGDREAHEIGRGGESTPDPPGGDGFREDVHGGERDPEYREADAGDLAQQNASGATLLGVQAVLS